MTEHYLLVHRQEPPTGEDALEAHRRLFPRCPLDAATAFHAQNPQHPVERLLKRALKLQAGYDPQDELEVRLARHLEGLGLL